MRSVVSIPRFLCCFKKKINQSIKKKQQKMGKRSVLFRPRAADLKDDFGSIGRKEDGLSVGQRAGDQQVGPSRRHARLAHRRHEDSIRYHCHTHTHTQRSSRSSELLEDAGGLTRGGVGVREAVVVDGVEREQVVEELIAFVVAAQEGVALVQRPEQGLLGEQRGQVLEEQLLLQAEADPGAGVAQLRLDVRHVLHVPAHRPEYLVLGQQYLLPPQAATSA